MYNNPSKNQPLWPKKRNYRQGNTPCLQKCLDSSGLLWIDHCRKLFFLTSLHYVRLFFRPERPAITKNLTPETKSGTECRRLDKICSNFAPSFERTRKRKRIKESNQRKLKRKKKKAMPCQAYVKARYDSRPRRSMETRLTLRFPTGCTPLAPVGGPAGEAGYYPAQ